MEGRKSGRRERGRERGREKEKVYWRLKGHRETLMGGKRERREGDQRNGDKERVEKG